MSEEPETTPDDHPNPDRLWRHRRWMGWYGVIGATGSVVIYLGVLMTGLVDAQTAEAAQPVVQTSIWAHLFLAVIYQGGASIVDGVAKLRHGA